MFMHDLGIIPSGAPATLAPMALYGMEWGAAPPEDNNHPGNDQVSVYEGGLPARLAMVFVNDARISYEAWQLHGHFDAPTG